MADIDWAAYTEAYPDLVAAAQASGMDEASFGQQHYAQYGEGEGRVAPPFAVDPPSYDEPAQSYGGFDVEADMQQPGVDWAAYTAAYPDLAAAAAQSGQDAATFGALHYAQYGQNEGRQTNGFAVPNAPDAMSPPRNEGALAVAPLAKPNANEPDWGAYVAANPDIADFVAQNGLDAATYGRQHFIDYGMNEGRQVPSYASAPASTSPLAVTPPAQGQAAAPNSFSVGQDIWSNYAAHDPGMQAEAAKLVGVDPRFKTPEDYYKWHYQHYGAAEGRGLLDTSAMSPTAQQYVREMQDYMATTAGANSNAAPVSQFNPFAAGVTSADIERMAASGAPVQDRFANTYTAYTNGGDPRFVTATQNQPVMLRDTKTGNVIFQGVGPDAAAQAVQMASQISQDRGKKADWEIYTQDGAGHWSAQANDQHDYSSPIAGIISDIALPILMNLVVPGSGFLSTALASAGGSALSSVAQGRSLQDTLLRAGVTGLTAGALGGTTAGRNLIGGITGKGAAWGAGALSGSFGASQLVGNAGADIISGGANNLLSELVVQGVRNVAPSLLSQGISSGAGALAGSGLGAFASGAGSGAGGAFNPPDAPTPVDEIQVTASQAPSGPDFAVPVPISPSLGGGSPDPFNVPAPGLDVATPVDEIEVSAPRNDPLTVAPFDPLQLIGSGVSPVADPGPLTPFGQPNYTPPGEQPTEVAPIVVTPPPQSPLTPPVVLPPILPTGGGDTLSGQFGDDTLATGSGNDTIAGGGGGLGVSPQDVIKAITLLSGIGGGSGGGGGNAGTRGSLSPIFSAQLPGASTVRPNVPRQISKPYSYWKRYAIDHPELSFFENVPQLGPERFAVGGHAVGKGTGRSDDIPARLSDGEFVVDAETVALLGDGSNKAGAEKLEKFRVNLRRHKGAGLAKGRFSVAAKPPEAYLTGGRA